jgi:lipopolysaccharide/colanic/teichoic acid biosynthesis glycosyltransferase
MPSRWFDEEDESVRWWGSRVPAESSRKAGNMSEHMPRRQPVAHSQPAPGGASIRYANGRVKRAFDLTAGVVLSIVTAPIVALLAVGSAVSFRAWPIFVQKRLGRDGRPFCFVKLRTLPTDTPLEADKYAIAGTTTTRWGGFLRASHLDELPQCWMVVTGRMSLVGPRPEMPALAARFDAAFMGDRLAVRPGITGPWQVSTALSGLIGEAPEFDRLYLAYAGPRLDAWVLLRTTGMLVGLQPLPLERFPGWLCNGSAPAGASIPDVDIAAQTADARPQTRSAS